MSTSTSTIAVLGPCGTFSASVARKAYPNSELVFQSTHEDVFKSLLENTDAETALVAIENQVAGSLRSNLDLLSNYDIHICEEVLSEIHHALLGNAELAQLKTILLTPHNL